MILSRFQILSVVGPLKHIACEIFIKVCKNQLNSSSSAINKHVNCIKVTTLQNVILVYTKTNYQQNFLASKEVTDYKTLHKIKMTIQIFLEPATNRLLESTTGVCFQKNWVLLFPTKVSVGASSIGNMIKSIKILSTRDHKLVCDMLVRFSKKQDWETFPQVCSVKKMSQPILKKRHWCCFFSREFCKIFEKRKNYINSFPCLLVLLRTPDKH